MTAFSLDARNGPTLSGPRQTTRSPDNRVVKPPLGHEDSLGGRAAVHGDPLDKIIAGVEPLTMSAEMSELAVEFSLCSSVVVTVKKPHQDQGVGRHCCQMAKPLLQVFRDADLYQPERPGL